MKALLLYDTKEKDLARDLQGFLQALDLEVTMIPLSPNLGKTLQAKEQHYFGDPDAAIFLVTPGSLRDGAAFPSPSVADEMGRAKQLFSARPERVLYLVDRECQIQAVDQTSHIRFDRANMRSVVEALTVLLRGLRAAGLIGKARVATQQVPAANVAQLAKETPDHLRAICVELSKLPDGAATLLSFSKILAERFGMSVQEANFATRDLQSKGLMTLLPTGTFYLLTELGWELVRHEMKGGDPMTALIERAIKERTKGTC